MTPATTIPTTTPLRTATFALTRRWLWRLERQPLSMLVSLVQPAVWLILFGNLFQNTTVVQDHSYIPCSSASLSCSRPRCSA